ncbi:MAG: hypothetical protein K0B07_00035 [DPANN group archaeon]|nr:hypothetical protein [DPANN group archaeon]
MLKDKYFSFYYVSVILLSIFFLCTSLVYSAEINVNVAEHLDTVLKEIDCCKLNDKVMTASFDVFNSGSIAYAARIRLDVFDEDNDKKITSVWSSSSEFNPGQRDSISLYWYEPSDTTRIAKVRLYRGYDILNLEEITWRFNKSVESQLSKGFGEFADSDNIFGNINFEDVRVYEHNIRFKITADEDIEKVIVYPVQYKEGWIFEQTVVEDVIADKPRIVDVNYDTGFFYENEITLVAVSSDGEYYGEQKVLLKKESGIRKWLNLFVDMLKI